MIKEGSMMGYTDPKIQYNIIKPDEIASFDKFNAFWKLK